MRNAILCIVILTGARISILAQQDTTWIQKAKNCIFIELGGNNVSMENEWLHGWLYALHYNGSQHISPLDRFSVNYDRIIEDTPYHKTSVRLGTMIPYNGEKYFISSLMVNRLFGRKKIYFELGIGGELIYYNPDLKMHGAFTSVLGFRYEETRNGFVFRAGITPTIGSWDNATFLGANVGISLGYNF